MVEEETREEGPGVLRVWYGCPVCPEERYRSKPGVYSHECVACRGPMKAVYSSYENSERYVSLQKYADRYQNVCLEKYVCVACGRPGYSYTHVGEYHRIPERDLVDLVETKVRNRRTRIWAYGLLSAAAISLMAFAAVKAVTSPLNVRVAIGYFAGSVLSLAVALVVLFAGGFESYSHTGVDGRTRVTGSSPVGCLLLLSLAAGLLWQGLRVLQGHP